jgi:DNA-binding transcriptional LysR family regulator
MHNMDLNEIAVFIKVVQAQSFSRAAQELGMPNSTVSSRVSSLEKRLGLTLIHRTTRKLKITDMGQSYFKHCLQGLEEIERAESEILATQREPQGLFKITAPVELGGSVLPGLIAEYLKKYPKVNIEVILTDRRVDLLAEGIDLAIRAGELKDSTLIVKKLGNAYFAAFAAPKYLKAHGHPKQPKDLSEHLCLQFTPLGIYEWKLKSQKSSATIKVGGRMILNDLNLVKLLAVNATGIALLPTFLCHEDVQLGRLTRILPDWNSTPGPVHFVYPAQKFVLPKLSAFISLATETMRESLKG